MRGCRARDLQEGTDHQALRIRIASSIGGRNWHPETDTGTAPLCEGKQALPQRNRRNRKPKPLEPFHAETESEPGQPRQLTSKVPIPDLRRGASRSREAFANTLSTLPIQECTRLPTVLDWSISMRDLRRRSVANTFM